MAVKEECYNNVACLYKQHVSREFVLSHKYLECCHDESKFVWWEVIRCYWFANCEMC